MSKISTYDDLLAEKKRLKELHTVQRELVRLDIGEIKNQFKPVMETASFLGKVITRDQSNPLLNMGVSSVIDLVVKNVFLSKAGWFGRNVIPFFLKNYSSHVVDDNIEGIKNKFFSFIKKFSHNGKKVDE
jgi:hypothetical protein